MRPAGTWSGGVCRSTSEFEQRIYGIAKDEMARRGVPPRPVGTNSEHPGLDYRAYHGFHVPPGESIPVIVNETDNEDHDPAQYSHRTRFGLQRGGVYFQGWRGPLDQSKFDELLDLVKDIAEGTPDPPDMNCNPPTGSVIKEHNHPSPGHYVIDATPTGTMSGPTLGTPRTERVREEKYCILLAMNPTAPSFRLGKEVPTGSLTRPLNAGGGGRREGEGKVSAKAWFGSETERPKVDVELTEEVIGLGRYGRTLTVVMAGGKLH